eukprot:161670_1
MSSLTKIQSNADVKLTFDQNNKLVYFKLESNQTVMVQNDLIEEPAVNITGYWEGYTEENQDPFPLNKVPETVNYISIAFIMPVKKTGDKLATDWDFDDSFIYTKAAIKKWVKEINQRGTNQKVLLSILDTPTCHWYPDVNIDEFAKNISASVEEWGLGGIDVDAESGMDDPSEQYVKTFVNLIKSLKKYMSSEKVISYTCYTESSFDTDIIKQCKDDINYINTMAYWNNTDGQIALYNHYAQCIGDPNKVGIGCKAGNGGDSTSLDTVKGVAEWYKNNDSITKKRMMLWSLTRDIKEITRLDDETYLSAMVENIQSGKQRKRAWYMDKDKHKQSITTSRAQQHSHSNRYNCIIL